MRGCPDPNFRIEPVLRAVDAEVVLRAFDDIFEPNLSAQVGDLAAYAEKLENCGRLLVARRCDSRELLGFMALLSLPWVVERA